MSVVEFFFCIAFTNPTSLVKFLNCILTTPNVVGGKYMFQFYANSYTICGDTTLLNLLNILT